MGTTTVADSAASLLRQVDDLIGAANVVAASGMADVAERYRREAARAMRDTARSLAMWADEIEP